MSNEQREKPASRYLNLYLGGLKEAWVAYCAARNLNPGAAIRSAIEHQLKNSSEPLAFVSREPIAKEPRERFEIALTPSEKAAIKSRLDGKRSMRDWIASAIRGALTKEPQFGAAELAALADSNYQLLAMGRNLNQIARKMNERKAVDFPAERVKDIERVIAAHTKAVSAVMRASQERWPLA